MDNHNTRVYETNSEIVFDHNGFSYSRNGYKVFSMGMDAIRVFNLVMALIAMTLVFTGGALSGTIGLALAKISLLITLVIFFIRKNECNNTESN